MSKFNIVGVFCDDIREEKDDRQTLIGVYPDNIQVSNIPGAFSRLSIYVRALLAPDAEVDGLVVFLRFPNGQEVPVGSIEKRVVAAELQKAKTSGSPYAGFIFKANAASVPIITAGRILGIVKLNGEETIAVSLNVQRTS